jgi:lysozyme family protein
MPTRHRIDDLRDRIIDGIIDREGGYVDDPSDRGGATRFGITADVARSYGYEGEMPDLPRDIAAAIYADLYWHTLHLDDVAAISTKIAAELADTGVNMGVGTAGRFLQRALNALNDGARLYPDLIVDGVIGPRSIAALRAYAAHRGDHGPMVLIAALNALQGARYVSIAENTPSQERFAFGWFAHRVAADAFQTSNHRESQ